MPILLRLRRGYRSLATQKLLRRALKTLKLSIKFRTSCCIKTMFHLRVDKIIRSGYMYPVSCGRFRKNFTHFNDDERCCPICAKLYCRMKQSWLKLPAHPAMPLRPCRRHGWIPRLPDRRRRAATRLFHPSSRQTACPCAPSSSVDA